MILSHICQFISSRLRYVFPDPVNYKTLFPSSATFIIKLEVHYMMWVPNTWKENGKQGFGLMRSLGFDQVEYEGKNITGSSCLYKLSGPLTSWTARHTAVSQTFHHCVHSCICALLFVSEFHWTCAHNIVCAQYKIKERFGKCLETVRHNFLSLSWFWCHLSAGNIWHVMLDLSWEQ